MLRRICSASSGVKLWCIEEYLAEEEHSSIIYLTWIKGPIGRKAITIGSSNEKAWATISLDTVIIDYTRWTVALCIESFLQQSGLDNIPQSH